MRRIWMSLEPDALNFFEMVLYFLWLSIMLINMILYLFNTLEALEYI